MIADWWQFGLAGMAALVLLAINGTFVACETALVQLRYQLDSRDALERLRQRRRIAFLLDRARSVAAMLRFGIMAATVASGVLLVAAVTFLLAGPTPGKFMAWPFAVALLVSASLVSLLGYLVPRSIALARPVWALRATSWAAAVLVLMLLPWYRLQRISARVLFRMLGLTFEESYNVLDVEVQIGALTDEDAILTPQMQRILRNALRLRNLDVSAIVLPRHQVKHFDLNDPVGESVTMARASGHTRFPLCNGDLDHCEGLIHIKDIFRSGADPATLDLSRLRREILRFPEDLPLERALQDLLRNKIHMALVQDEFGGVIGIVTLETILEELVGNIEDEFDSVEEERIQTVKPGEYRIAGLAPIHEVQDILGVVVENDEAATFGGLITANIGRIPEVGETIILEDPPLEITILQADETRIVEASARPVLTPSEADDTA